MAEIDIASPLMYSGITTLCRVSKNGLIAECSACGVGVIGHVHMPEVVWGFYCSECCPIWNGLVTLTPEEEKAMQRNRLRATREPKGVVEVQQPDPPEEKPSRSEMMKRRWRDPEARRRMMDGMTGLKWANAYPIPVPVLQRHRRSARQPSEGN